MRVDTFETPFELTHPTHLKMMFYRNDLNATKMD